MNYCLRNFGARATFKARNSSKLACISFCFSFLMLIEALYASAEIRKQTIQSKRDFNIAVAFRGVSRK